MTTTKGEITFGLVHGSWHGAWCWGPLQDALGSLHYRSVAMDLPSDDPDATFDDCATVVADALKDADNVVLVGHSRAGNTIPRAATRLAARQLIFLCSSFEPATIGHPLEGEAALMPPRNSDEFQKGITEIPNGLTVFDRDIAKGVFFHDCPPATQDWAVDHFRPQRRSHPEPALTDWPKLPQEYIICRDDRVLNPDWSRYVAQHWLKVNPVELPGGHSPFLSRPEQLAHTLVALAEQPPAQAAS